MKSLHYIIGFLVCALFFSCEVEEIIREGEKEQITPEEDGTYLINPEDTAGIVVPEGYKLVLFPGVKKQTRANATGTNTQVKHLQYLIYQKDGEGTYKQIKQAVLSKPESWPSKVPAIPLEENKEYRVVFLGNIDKSLFSSTQTDDLLTGVGEGTNYADAQIHLPQVEFDDTNLFYMANSIFDTKAGSITDNSVYVPITLKRIVNKVEICKEPLKDTSKDYTQDNLIEQVLGEKITPKLGSTGGALHRGIAASIDTLVMAMVYVGTKNSSTDAGRAAKADAFWEQDKLSYPVLKYRYNNIGAGKEFQLPTNFNSKTLDEINTSREAWHTGLKRSCEYAYIDDTGGFTQNAIVRLAQNVYDFFHKGIDNNETNDGLFGNNGAIPNTWSIAPVASIDVDYKGICTFRFEASSSTTNLGYLLLTDFTALFKNMVNAEDVTAKLKRDFNPLGIRNAVYSVQVNRMPSVVNFDLEVTGFLNEGKSTELYLTMKPAGYKGPSISVVSLGSPADQLTIQAVGKGYSGIWDGNILTVPKGGTSSQSTILQNGESLSAIQRPNVYKKCVYSTGTVDLNNWDQTVGGKYYPIMFENYSYQGLDAGIKFGIPSIVGTSDGCFVITEKDDPEANYKNTLYINGEVLAPGMLHGTAQNLVSIYSDIQKALRVRTNYLSNTSHIAWIELPVVKDNLNDYTSGWTITNENYNTVSE